MTITRFHYCSYPKYDFKQQKSKISKRDFFDWLTINLVKNSYLYKNYDFKIT